MIHGESLASLILEIYFTAVVYFTYYFGENNCSPENDLLYSITANN